MNPGVPAFGKKLFWFSKFANLKSMMNAFVLLQNTRVVFDLRENVNLSIKRVYPSDIPQSSNMYDAGTAGQGGGRYDISLRQPLRRLEPSSKVPSSGYTSTLG